MWQVDTGRLILTCSKLTPVWRHCIARGHAANPGKGQTWSFLLSPCSPEVGHGGRASPAWQNDQQSLPECTGGACSYPEVPKCRKPEPTSGWPGAALPYASSCCLVGFTEGFPKGNPLSRENKSCKKFKFSQDSEISPPEKPGVFRWTLGISWRQLAQPQSSFWEGGNSKTSAGSFWLPWARIEHFTAGTK